MDFKGGTRRLDYGLFRAYGFRWQRLFITVRILTEFPHSSWDSGGGSS